MLERISPVLTACALALLLSGPASAAAPVAPLQLAAETGNPQNSPIRRANPNSRQGTLPAMPPAPGPSTAPNPRPPTLENRGIGNGDNLRREQQTPRLEPIRPPRESLRTP